MKLISTTSWYFPDSSGGVEVYLDGLIQGLQPHGIETQVAVSDLLQTQERNYQYKGVNVYRYPVAPCPNLSQEKQQLPPLGFSQFADWLSSQSVDIYHQHSWRYGCGLHHLRLARQLGLPTIVTIHMPEAVCLRGTMMHQEQYPCDGYIDPVRCGRCYGVPKRVPAPIIQGISQLPASIGLPLAAKLTSAPDVRIRQLGRTIAIPLSVKIHRQSLLEMANLADRIVAVCQWLYDAFLLNGVPPEKLVLCRQGVSYSSAEKKQFQQQSPLKIGFLGRWQETKGIQILVEAIHRLDPDIPVELTIHGMLHGEAGKNNRERVLAIAEQDSRIRVAQKLSREEVPQHLAGFDILAVPSQWLETGPLVVLEAYAVGTPVIGSHLGGIAELVRHGVDGWLVSTPTEVSAWTEAIAYLATHRDLIRQFHQNILPVRTMQNVADEMAGLYQEILNQLSVDPLSFRKATL
ncbi:Glycosyl transferase group 1 [Planktothrix sp. PCC 11201]|uniref:glycosyltransferase n=1 Tax=Planktothrix sp. PCC 11201 TaxID=1729650 RepID=UPI000911A708|nr:glycosyltransferase [Planktothrix sp. PCC 11201]SKB14656.1 Glycosyl transferase group 1 [Planktothrix sp. PCC 11201]